jgi:diacylglycerol kinase (ATP)
VASPLGPILLIANPAAGLRRGAVLARTVDALNARGLDHRVVLTRGPGDATRFAREAVGRGQRFLVAAGGDGTVHEVVNGLIDSATGRPYGEAILGVVPGGSGCDLVRSYTAGASLEQLVAHLDGDGLQRIDVGRVRLLGLDGRERVRLFVNIAEAGFGGAVTQRANRLPRFLGATRYLLAVFASLRQLSMVPTTVSTDAGQIRSPLCNIVVANGRFFGGNMRVAPHALLDDGCFDVQVWQGTAGHALVKTGKVRRGEHLTDPAFRELRSTTVQVDADRPLVVEADGEVLGTTPASFDLLPGALHLKR